MEENKKKMKWWVKTIIIVGIIINVLVGTVKILGPKYDTGNYRTLILNSIVSNLSKTSNEKVDELLNKTDGIIHGVCHPNGDYEGMNDANINWVRFDLTSLPYDEDGNLTDGYKYFKEKAKTYQDNGFKVMCVTQYPKVYIEAGYDPRDEKGKEKIKEMANFIVKDLQGCVSAFQITNEMGVDRFRSPLSLEESVDYIGIQLEAMYEDRGDIIIGFNLADFSMENYFLMMKPYWKYCDYIGLDLYLGCFENMFKELWIYDMILRGFWQQAHIPMIVNEFGYIGYGQPKTDEEKIEILKEYGYSSEEEARNDIINFINNEKFPTDLKDTLYKAVENQTAEELAFKLFDDVYRDHLYRELSNGYQLNDYKHTPDDQAKFYTDVIKEHFMKMDFLCGAFMYMYTDSSACYICGQSDCPVETGWGLLDLNGNKKPAYYAVKEAYGEWK